MSDRLGDRFKWAVEYEAIGTTQAFRHRSCGVTINGFNLIATASTPVSVKVEDAVLPSLLVPFHGSHLSILDGQRLNWRQQESAVLMPACARAGEARTRSALMLDIVPERLDAVAAAMLGRDPDDAPAFVLDQARLVDLRLGPLAFAALLGNLCRQVDVLLDTPELLAHSGLDDTFYRVLAWMLNPAPFFEAPARESAVPAHKLDRVCQYILSRLDQPLALSELELIGCMSRRSLQYAFQQRFGCTPMQWVLRERLNQARGRLAAPSPGLTVTTVALACGFTNLSRFAAQYRRRFGEPPSVTLGRSTLLA